MLYLIPVAFASLGLMFSVVEPDVYTVRHDTEIPVEVHTTIKSDSAKVGDTVEFVTAEAVLIGNNIVVPENSTILGTVVEVRNRDKKSHRSLVRIRIHTLRWKTGEARLNAMVTSVRHGHVGTTEWGFRSLPTFMEGIRIVSHIRPETFTDFFSDEKNFTIRSGVSLTLRQIDPAINPDYDYGVLSTESKTARDFSH